MNHLDGPPVALRLITCSNFDDSIGHYVGNTVVFAHLTALRHTPEPQEGAEPRQTVAVSRQGRDHESQALASRLLRRVTMYKKVLACAAVVALSSISLAAPSADATHSWGGYHWARTSNPFTVKLGDNLTSVWKTYLGTTSSDWSKSTVLDTRIVAGSTTAKKCAATAGMVQVCNAAYGQRGWLGIASINISGLHITQGTVKLNDTYFATAQYNNPAERNLVMCQEVGHTFGLDHQDENFTNPPLGTCMDYSNDPAPNQHPNQHDYDELVTIYSHLDSTTTVGAAVTHGKTGRSGNSPKSWGARVAGSRNQGVSTYIKHLGNGHKILTRVIWAR